MQWRFWLVMSSKLRLSFLQCILFPAFNCLTEYGLITLLSFRPTGNLWMSIFFLLLICLEFEKQRDLLLVCTVWFTCFHWRLWMLSHFVDARYTYIPTWHRSWLPLWPHCMNIPKNSPLMQLLFQIGWLTRSQRHCCFMCLVVNGVLT